MPINFQFQSKSLNQHPQLGAIQRILAASLEAAEPAKAVEKAIFIKDNSLKINNVGYPLDEFDHIYIIAFGKAAPSMASAAASIFGKKLHGGIVVSKYGTEDPLANLEPILAGHPVPDERSLAAGRSILALLENCSQNDLVIFLISGGGSALITAPIDGVRLSDLQELTSLLLASGARIDEINTLRRVLDQVKGGGLAKAAYPAKIASLILSDVVDSPLEAIASGPTIPNPTTPADALAVLEKYNLLDNVSTTITLALKKSQTQPKNSKITIGNTSIIGSNKISAEAAKAQAIQEGFQTFILTTSMQGEAAQRGQELGVYLCNMETRPQCVIVGGETTVTLGNATGLGGRNQELALATAKAINGAQDVMLITLATDGDDGPTDAAGAVVTGETWIRAQKLGLPVDTHLQEHNAYPFFKALDDLLITGSTGTNVNDLTFLFTFKTQCTI